MKEQGKQDENSEANPSHVESFVTGVAEEGEGGKRQLRRDVRERIPWWRTP